VASTVSLSGTVNLSMGCHSGYSVPDENAPASRQLDFAQALSRRGGWWIGNTGFGYGMDDAVSFTERVMSLLTDELTRQTSTSVGEAFQRAKQRYLGSTPSGGFGTYDEKAIVEATLYGLPMYQVNWGLYAETQVKQESVIEPLTPVQPTTLNAVVVSITPTFQLVTAISGTSVVGQYYTVGGEAQANPGHPVQPRTGVTLTTIPGMTPHGALFRSGSIANISNFNPLISRPVTDTALPEPAYNYPGWYPAKIYAVNRLGDQPRLVLVPAQYQGDANSGVESLYQQMDFMVYYADAGQADMIGPSIWEVDSLLFKGVATFAVSAQDDSGMERVVITYSADGVHWQSADLAYNSLTDRWEGNVAGLNAQTNYFVQAVDKAGNASMSANKGLFFAPERHDIYLPVVMKK
jgi:hypothetical protein